MIGFKNYSGEAVGELERDTGPTITVMGYRYQATSSALSAARPSQRQSLCWLRGRLVAFMDGVLNASAKTPSDTPKSRQPKIRARTGRVQSQSDSILYGKPVLLMGVAR